MRIIVDLPLELGAAFEAVLEQLALDVGRHGLRFDAGSGGRVIEGDAAVASTAVWTPGKRLVLLWRPAPWQPERTIEVEVRSEPRGEGATVTIEVRDLEQLVDGAGELAGWFAGEVAAPLLRALAPNAFGDWVTDRQARRPSGPQSRGVYRDPLYHYPNFRVILDELALTPADYLLEVGCGGGALLKAALRSGCRAAAVDHSADMVRLTREENREAVAAGRLRVEEASAESLPFPDATFTRAAMTGVLGFLPDPVAAFREIRRVLAPGGLLVALGSDPELKHTPAVPEPMASRLRFYEDDALAQLARDAGFREVQVVRRELLEFAREAGVPEEHLPLFAGPDTRFLLARRD